jgi:hypothetical protein
MKTTRYLWSYFCQFFLELKVFQVTAVEELKSHICIQ